MKTCRRGFAILTVIFVMVVFAFLGVAAVALITGSAWLMRDEYHTNQAFDVADAGLSYIAKQLVDDSSWLDNPDLAQNFGPGSFSVTYLAKTADTCTVRIDGTVEGITRSIKQSFSKSGPEAWSKVLYTQSSVVVSGSANGVVVGDVSAAETIDDDQGVIFTGDNEENNTDADVPDSVWSYWQSVADHVVDADRNFDSGVYDGIYYITGNVTFGKDVVLNGSIISRGSVMADGTDSLVITTTAPNPAILAQGSVTFTGNSDLVITGWVISYATITMIGNTDIVAQGGFSAVGDITFTGNADAALVYNAALSPALSPGFTGGAVLSFGQWEEIY